jgi:hypothetical protein
MLTDMMTNWFRTMATTKSSSSGFDILNVFSRFFSGTPTETPTGGVSSNSDWGLTPLGIPNPVAPPATNAFFSGGIINEPVFGIGTKSGESYSFAERGPERVISNKELNSTSSAPNVTVNVINESGVPLAATNGGSSFDGDKYITSIIVKQMSTNPAFRGMMKG